MGNNDNKGDSEVANKRYNTTPFFLFRAPTCYLDGGGGAEGYEPGLLTFTERVMGRGSFSARTNNINAFISSLNCVMGPRHRSLSVKLQLKAI